MDLKFVMFEEDILFLSSYFLMFKLHLQSLLEFPLSYPFTMFLINAFTKKSEQEVKKTMQYLAAAHAV